MTDKELLEKAIGWFNTIADDADRLTTGNLPHNKVTLRGRAIRAAEFLEKHKNEEPVSEELCDAANDYGVNIRKGYPRVMDETDKYIYNAFKDGAKWRKQQIINKACEWLEDHADDYEFPYCPGYDSGALVEDFRKAMEE